MAEWPLKASASVAFTVLFFAGYFLLLTFPVFTVKTMPVLRLDGLIPFQPEALWLYGSLWLYVQLPAALMLTRTEVFSYGKEITALALAGFAIFFFWPTKLAPSDIDWMKHAAFQTLKEVDASGNACPSLHVAFAVYSGLSIGRSLRGIGGPMVLHILNTFWCVGIAYSTLATRQHVVLDVLAGAGLALLVAGVARSMEKRSRTGR